jgi:mono/diheme cytochrome c family protein
MGSAPRRTLASLLVVVPLIALGVAAYFFFRPAGPPAVQPMPQLTPEELRLARGRDLYGIYCLACHGDKGEGDGTAARYLSPRPRNFGEGKFRIVSTVNAYPADDDLLYVITHGMPGSAMLPFAHLSEDDRKALVAQVRELAHASVERQLTQAAAERGGGDIDTDWVAERLEKLTHVGDPLEVPALGEATPASVARGAEVYRQTCTGCHGLTGKGDGAQEQRNWDGTPTRPRDFTRGVFKGGRDPRQLYDRVFLGMPGSPMPSASGAVKSEDIPHLVNFLLSLSDPASQERVEHRRRVITAKRAAGGLPADGGDDAWKAAEQVGVVVSPLWWRDYDDPDLRVAALHDGQSLAVRLTWHDATKNAQAVRPQDFEDMAAVQLYKGSPEPFLGMGMADKALDVWLWRAGWAAKPGEAADVDTTYPNMAVDGYPFERPGDGPRPHAADRQDPEFLTAHAAGNQLADPSRPLSAANLEARGFGTLTMRPRTSQAVTARGDWKDGRWTVVLRRPLDPGAKGGVVVAPGDGLSVAFALWDGAARDRNGQKLVSIWHDLRLEK